jgi:hypothetical protein
MGFDTNKIGSLEFYEEFERIVNVLESSYNNGMSIEDIKKIYNFNHNETVRRMFKSLGIERRNLKDALNNFNKV